MKKKHLKAWSLMAILLVACLLHWLGVGYASSSSAMQDLLGELQAIHGEEYTGRETAGETEDMAFVIEPKTWFLTNWNLRQSLGWDYTYDCKVIYTRYADGGQVHVRTITYQGIDPMGEGRTTDRAYIDIHSKAQTDSTA